MKNLYLLISLFFSAVSLFAQQKDSRTREYLSPTRIVWQQEEALITGVEHLLRPGTGQSDLTNKYICKIISTDKQHPALLLDFGKELQGGLQIVTGMPKSHEPIAIRVRFGESVGIISYGKGFEQKCVILMKKMVLQMTMLCATLSFAFRG